MKQQSRSWLLLLVSIGGVILMYLAIFFETAASATNDYRFGMTCGLALTILADALFYWVFRNGGLASKVVACAVALPATMFVALDWVLRAPSVFAR